MRILVNDGIHDAGKEALEAAGFELDFNNVAQEDLINRLNDYDAILVRSATKVREEHMKAAPNLKVIGRGGVGLDNIDVEYAENNGVAVLNTPAASTRSVAELAIAHLFSIVRFLPRTNKMMATDGMSNFKALKKESSKGTELHGKTLGLIGFGRIGRETASIAMGCGMKIIAFDPYLTEGDVALNLHPDYANSSSITIKTISKEDLLKQADFISLHIPGGQGYVLDEAEFAMMKPGMGIVNCARGGTINESALIAALDSGQVDCAATDVFENEPPTDERILRIEKVGLSPHIGASTQEAQTRVGLELAERVINALK